MSNYSNDNKKTGCNISIPIVSISIIVGITFVILKLCNVISWDWIYVCIPFIVAAGCWVLSLIIVGIIALIALIIYKYQN